VWALGLPHGTTNYKAGKVCQTADHAVFNKSFVTLDAPPIRVQPSSMIPFEGLTGIDEDEMCGERDTAPTAKQIKDEIGSDHTNILMSVRLRPHREEEDKSKPSPQPTSASLIEHMKLILAKSKRTGIQRRVANKTIIANGATLHVNKTLGDGNCFYHSIYECLTGSRSSNDCQAQMRAQAVRTMLTDITVQTHLFGEHPDEQAMLQVAGELLQDGLWTEDFAPSFVAEALNLEICVVTEAGQPYYTASPTVARSGLRTIVCVFTGNHYNSCTEVALPALDLELFK
ncbi:MAG: OTU domain-containing protein, partial [Kofleriaceae bacterium]